MERAREPGKRHRPGLADLGTPSSRPVTSSEESAWYATGTSDPRWQSTLGQLRAHPVYGRDFEVVSMGPVTGC